VALAALPFESMSDRKPHKNQDSNSRLARELGRRLEEQPGDEPLSRDTHDPFVGLLLSYRKGVREEARLPHARSLQLWAQLRQSASSQTGGKLTLLRGLGRWGAAAAACAALVVGLYAWLGDTEEMILASTGSSIETITLADGSSVTLRPHSSFYLVDQEARRYRLDGEALLAVTHLGEQEIVVETALASVTVLGTTFDVSTWANEIHVYLSQGKVRIDHYRADESVILEPGQAAIVDRNTINHPSSEASGSTYLDWLNNELSFDHSPSYRVAAELGHHFGVELVIPSELANETLSGRILLTSLDHGLDDLSTVFGGRFEPTGESSFVLVPN